MDPDTPTDDAVDQVVLEEPLPHGVWQLGEGEQEGEQVGQPEVVGGDQGVLGRLLQCSHILLYFSTFYITQMLRSPSVLPAWTGPRSSRWPGPGGGAARRRCRASSRTRCNQTSCV